MADQALLETHNPASFRTLRGFATRSALAAAADVHPRTVDQIESGDVRITVGSLSKVAHALGIEAWQLLQLVQRMTAARVERMSGRAKPKRRRGARKAVRS